MGRKPTAHFSLDCYTNYVVSVMTVGYTTITLICWGFFVFVFSLLNL